MAMLIAGIPGASLSQDARKPDVETKKTEAEGGDGVQQYCGNIANFRGRRPHRLADEAARRTASAGEAKNRRARSEGSRIERLGRQARRADEKAEDGVVAIYAKMEPEAAAAQMGVLDEATAAAVLAKLKPGVSSAILNEMEPKSRQTDQRQSGLASQPADRKKS